MLNLLVKSPGVFCLLTEQQQVPDSLKNKNILTTLSTLMTLSSLGIVMVILSDFAISI